MTSRKPPRRIARQPLSASERRTANIVGVAVIAIFAGIGLLSVFRVRIPLPEIPLPRQFDSIPARLILALAAFILVAVLIALAFKLVEVRRAARWHPASARIIRSERAVQLGHRAGDATPEETPVADIAYAYQVSGVDYVGNRATLAERMSENDIAALLARYPVGAVVMAHYNPADPSESVIERKLPGGWGGCLVALVAGVVFTGFAMRLVTEGPAALEPHLRAWLPDAHLPFMGVFTVAAALFLGTAWAIARPVLQVRRWPVARGGIETSGVLYIGGPSRGYHRPEIAYWYEVGGQRFRSRAVEHDAVSSGSRGWAQKIVDRHPPGAEVDVRYNPADPSQSALIARFGIGWIPLAVGALLALAAFAAAGVL